MISGYDDNLWFESYQFRYKLVYLLKDGHFLLEVSVFSSGICPLDVNKEEIIGVKMLFQGSNFIFK